MIDGLALAMLLRGVGSFFPWGIPWFKGGSFDIPTGGQPAPKTYETVWPDPAPGTGRFRVALTWHPYAGEVTTELEAPGYDLDICKFNAITNALIACAASWDNTYEFMDVDMDKAVPHYLKVYAYPATAAAQGTRVTFGLAYYFDAYHQGD